MKAECARLVRRAVEGSRSFTRDAAPSKAAPRPVKAGGIARFTHSTTQGGYAGGCVPFM